jgi:hypothetical protein
MLRMGLDVNGAEFITDHFLEMEMLGSESAETGNPVEPSPHAAPEGGGICLGPQSKWDTPGWNRSPETQRGLRAGNRLRGATRTSRATFC